jgi:phenylalanine-4-hydroxylase
MLESHAVTTLSLPPPRAFTDEEHATWGDVVRTQRPRRSAHLVPAFERGLRALDMDHETIPSLDAVNARLRALTGWQGVFVKGLEDGRGFYTLLAQRAFPIGHFVRDRKDLTYTPEPDIIHDLYGHIPFFADPAYAEYCEAYGRLACRYLDDAVRLRRLERFFWFTLEFGLVETPMGRRIFGAGIASSVGECVSALSDEPEVLPFDVERLCAQEFRIDQMQQRLFVLPSVETLYGSFEHLKAVVAR